MENTKWGSRNRRPSAILAGIAAGLVLAAIARPVAGQTTTPHLAPAGSGLDKPLPSVPVRGPRSIEGDAPDQKFSVAADPPPVASFIQSLKANDSAIEVIVNQGRLLTLKADIATLRGAAVVAVGDPTVVEFEVLPNPRMIRVIGRRAGVTDLSITTADGQTYSFEIHVIYDLDLLRAQIRQVFPDVCVQLAQIREHLVVEGEARSTAQVTQILDTLQGYLESIQVPNEVEGEQGAERPGVARPPRARPPRARPPAATPNAPLPPDRESWATDEPPAEASVPEGEAEPEPSRIRTKAAFARPRIINLLKVPGVHQVLLKVRIAELNRTATRQIGADFLMVDPSSGNIMGTGIGGATVTAAGLLGLGGLTGAASGAKGTGTTAFGVFPSGDFELLITALRRNSLLAILAEPNLMALSGHRASFLAGGQFPVPVPQGGGGASNSVTIEFKDFGVQLDFIPDVQEDGTIRLSVTPEVSSIDFALGTTLVTGGDPVPGLTSRRATTTVELLQGQTLAIAGLLQVETDGRTDRIPGLGDLPYIGSMFSNTSHKKTEKELLVLVTPYLASPMNPDQVPPLPGEEIKEPNDLEFYLLNRIEGRTGRAFRSTTAWDDPYDLVRTLRLERRCVSGPVGFSD